MSRLFDAVSGAWEGPKASGVFPAMNITEDANSYYVRAELPGIKANDLKLTSVNRTLTLTGEREPVSEEDQSVHRQERSWGQFSRSVTLPNEFNADQVTAHVTNGLLTITLPKAEKVKPRSISVQVS